MRVLLVEDDPMIAQAIKGALADEMYTVEQVANGRDALMMLSLNDYGFVLFGAAGRGRHDRAAHIESKRRGQ